MLAYRAYLSRPACIASLDRSLDILFSSRVGPLATGWVRISEKLRLVPVSTVLSLALILGSWLAFPYAGPYCFKCLSHGAFLASVAALTGWWTWALARHYREGWRLLSFGTACGLLYLVAVLEGTLGYFYWGFARGYFLDGPGRFG